MALKFLRFPTSAQKSTSTNVPRNTAADGPEIGTLTVLVDRARNLPNRKLFGKQSPYCAAQLGKVQLKTASDRRGGQTPKWNEQLSFKVHESKGYRLLKLNVYNDEKKTELVGEASVDIDALVLRGSGGLEYWQPLNCRGKFAGEVMLKLSFSNSQGKRVSVQQPRRSSRIVSGEKRSMADACIRDDSTRRRKVTRKSAPSIFQESYTAAVEQSSTQSHGPRPIRTPKSLGPRSMVSAPSQRPQQQDPQAAAVATSQNPHTSSASNAQQQQQREEQPPRRPLQNRTPQVNNSQNVSVEADSSNEHTQHFDHSQPKGPPRIRLRRLERTADGNIQKTERTERTEVAQAAQAEPMVQPAKASDKKTQCLKPTERPAKKANHPPPPPTHQQSLPSTKQQQHTPAATSNQPMSEDSETLKPAPLSFVSKKAQKSEPITAAKPIPPHLHIPKNQSQTPPRKITPRKVSRTNPAKPRSTSGNGARVVKKVENIENITKPKTQYNPRRLATPESASKSKVSKPTSKTAPEPSLRLRQPSAKMQTSSASQQPLPSPRLTPEPECPSPKTPVHNQQDEQQKQIHSHHTQSASAIPTPPSSSNNSSIATPENPFAYIQEQLSMFTSTFTPTHSTASDHSPSSKYNVGITKHTNAQRSDPQIEAALKRLCDAEFAIQRLRKIASSSTTPSPRSTRRVSSFRQKLASHSLEPVNEPSYQPQTEDLGIAFI